MGGSNGNKSNFKGSDAEDMCSAGSVESDPRYTTCCSNVCTPGRVLRDMVVGLLVVIGIAAIVAAIFAVCFFLVPEENKFFEPELVGDAEGVIGGPPPEPESEPETEPASEINPTDADRYDIPPEIAKIEEEIVHHSHNQPGVTHTHDHSGHTHDHSGKPHDHAGHTHDHSGQPHDHVGHTNDHSGNHHNHAGHTHGHGEMDMNKFKDVSSPIVEITPQTNTEVNFGFPIETTHSGKDSLLSGVIEHTTKNAILSDIQEDEIPQDQIATASAGHLPAVNSVVYTEPETIPNEPKEEDITAFKPTDGIFPFPSSPRPQPPSESSSPLFDILGPRQTSESPVPVTTSQATTPESTPARTTTPELPKTTTTTTTTTTATQPPTTSNSFPIYTGVCVPRQLPLCSSAAPWTSTSFPNWVNDASSRDIASSLPYFRDIVINSRCSPRALEYTCAVLEPPCSKSGQPLPPCRAFCRSVASTCSEFLIKNLAQNVAFECDRFPDSDDPSVCVDLAEGCVGVEHRCPSTGSCISPRLVCDGVRDCTDGSDEANCSKVTSGTQTTPVTTSSITTTDKFSTPETWDMPFTFPNTPPTVEETTITEELAESTLSDTAADTTVTSPVDCPQLQCLDGKCITLSQLNDGVNDCIDGSDEQDFSAILGSR